MARMPVTGMSGTGKPTVLARLAERGHRVVDTDLGDWIAELPLPGGGRSGNQGQFRDRFDEVVDLVAARLAPARG